MSVPSAPSVLPAVMGLEAIEPFLRRSENKNNTRADDTDGADANAAFCVAACDGDGLTLPASRSRGRAVALPLMAALKVLSVAARSRRLRSEKIWPSPTGARTPDYPRKEPLGLRDSLPRRLERIEGFRSPTLV
jgi:hypothetical protein